MIVRIPKSLLTSIKDFYRDEGIYLSASLAFFSILSMIPLTIFVVNILLNLIQEERIVKFVYGKLIVFFPSIELCMIKELKDILASKEVSGISLILYGVFSLQLFTAIEFSLDKIFRATKKKHFFISLLMAIFIIFLITFTVAISFVLTYLIRFFHLWLFSELNIALGFFLKYILPFLLMFVIISLLYKILPNRKMKFRSILVGALITAILTEAAKYIFAFYVSKVIKISTLYGSVSTFLALLMWLFYAWAVFLYGAEVIKNIEKK